MSPIDITITCSTPTRPNFSWLDSLKGVEKGEIERLILILRSALAAFSVELNDRRKPRTDQELESFKKKLRGTAEQINKKGLTETHKGHLDSLKLLFAQAEGAQDERKDSKSSKAGREYLWLISNVIGWPYVLLITCALGRHKIERINEDRRVKLLRYIADNRDLLCCRKLEEIAVDHQFQKFDVEVNLPLTRGFRKRKRQESTDGTVHVKANDHPKSANLAAVVTSESVISTNIPPSASERSNSDPVAFSKTQVDPQTNVAALSRPLEGLRDLPHNVSLHLPEESIWEDGESRPTSYEDGNDNFESEFHSDPAAYLSVSNRKARTLLNAGSLFVLRDNHMSNVTTGSGRTIDSSGQIESSIKTSNLESHANKAQSNCAVSFNQEPLRPKEASSAEADNVVSGLEAEKVDNAMLKFCDRDRSIHKPMFNLAQGGLIKVQPTLLGGTTRSLTDFYVHAICAGRTLLKDNAYLLEVLPIADRDQATKHAVLALTLSYYKEYLPDDSIQKQQMKVQEVQAVARTLMALKQNTRNDHISRDIANMLLIHHAILNQNSHQVHWTKYLYQLQDSHGLQSNLLIAAHSVLLMTILPLGVNHRFQTYDYHWIGHGEQESLTKVNGILGMSRKMLFFQYLITVAAKLPNLVDNKNLLSDIEVSHQWVGTTETEMAKRIALKTAETYRLATRLYALVRLYRFTPSHPDVRAICSKLIRKLFELPVRGEEYSGLHPAWCFPIACACMEDPDDYTRMDRILDYIGSTNKSNVSDLLVLVRRIWNWKSGRQLSAEWWEDMTEYLDSVMYGNIVCVT